MTAVAHLASVGSTTRRRQAGLAFHAAMDLQRAELMRTVEFLAGLSAEDWEVPVPDCPGWTVRTMYLHVLGACEGAAPLEGARQLVRALRTRRKLGGPLEANLSSVQIDTRSNLDGAALVQRLTVAAHRTVKWRSRIPAPLRWAVRIKVDGPVVEWWSLGYLNCTIYLRDLWMHRIDASRALGKTPLLDATHDGVIVADVASEWARRHGQPADLELTGPAGSRLQFGEGGEHLCMDAVEFCRSLAGRSPGAGLLHTVVPF
jgi:uncharacterized protein (TIGR03083 family)